MKARSIEVREVGLLGTLHFCIAVLFMTSTNHANADLIACTSFEEPLAASSKYTDTGDATSDHALINNAGEPSVNWTQAGTELGFSSSYFVTRSSGTGIDKDSVGVMNQRATKGLQSFTMSDIDGLMTTTLDSVPFRKHLNVTLSLEMYIATTSWETDDHVRIWANVDGGAELDMFNDSGQIIESGNHEGYWQQLSLDLTGYKFGTLAFSLDSNANSEKIYIDNVQFRGDKIQGEKVQGQHVPVPGAFLLGCLGLGFALWLRRD